MSNAITGQLSGKFQGALQSRSTLWLCAKPESADTENIALKAGLRAGLGAVDYYALTQRSPAVVVPIGVLQVLGGITESVVGATCDNNGGKKWNFHKTVTGDRVFTRAPKSDNESGKMWILQGSGDVIAGVGLITGVVPISLVGIGMAFLGTIVSILKTDLQK